MYKEQTEILNSWKIFLAGIEKIMQIFIKAVLNESKNVENIHVRFFVYEIEPGDMDVMFLALDREENILFNKKFDILNSEHLFPEELTEKEKEIDDDYEGEDEMYDEYLYKYLIQKHKIFEEWFILCWDKIKVEYKDIPETFFSILDTNERTNLNTKKKVMNDEIFE